MKKVISLFLALIVMVSAVTGVGISAYADTKYYVDMKVAKTNIENLKNYVIKNGLTDSGTGDKFFRYENSYGYVYEIAYVNNSGVLEFDAFFGDSYNYVTMYYNYYNLNPEVQIVLNSDSAAATSVTFDCTEYYFQNLVFNVDKSFGNMSYSDIQEMSNLYLQAAIGGWDSCLAYNTPYRLYHIGFNALCDHKLATTYDPASFNRDGFKLDYCHTCGYNVQTDYAAIGKVSLSNTSYTFDGKVKTPAVTVKDNNGQIIDSSNYSVTYQSGRKNPGKYYVTVTFINGVYTGSQTLSFTINPKATSIKSVSAKSKAFKVSWNKQDKQTTGYQIQYATNSKFTKNKKTVTISKNKTTSTTVSKLKAKKTYYVRVRTYKTVNGTKVYSSWSKPKSVKIK